jgi:endo-1,3(4)-beta-glucanase
MGQSYSKFIKRRSARTDNSAFVDAWLSARKGVMHSFGYDPTFTIAAEIPPDNIFTRIQEDNILPQIPLGRHHPVPRKGVEDGDKWTMHTNKFYANAFLGEQNQPIWTYPYSVWWGKGVDETGKLKSMGLCIGHTEERDLEYGPGDPASVRIRQSCLRKCL